MNKEELYLAEDNLAAEIEGISEFVFNHAELGSEEFKSCNYLVEKLKEHGFTITCPYLDLDTAFRAELYCGEGPKLLCFRSMMRFRDMVRTRTRWPTRADITG